MIIKGLLPAALLLALSGCLLAACGGGGGAMVRAETVLPPPPPPPAASSEPCPAPVTADCVVDVPGSQDMTGGRQSDHKLIKRGEGTLTLAFQSSNDSTSPPIVDFRFGGGATIEDGSLRVFPNATLHSNVIVMTTGGLTLFGTMTGNATNHGFLLLLDKVIGDVVNDGVLEPGSSIYGEVIPAHVEGNFSQTPNGTLEAVIGATTGGFLSVTGHADIDGTLRLVQYTDDFGPYPLPGAPLSLKVLHADGGIFGQFTQWTSPGLFITGTLRYLANDTYFDVASISAAQVMSAAGADALTVQSAARFDTALGNAGQWARTPGAALTTAQQKFLVSVGEIQHLRDVDQAVRTLDSLSGHGYAAATDALLQQAATPVPELIAHIGNLHDGSASGSWSTQMAMMSSGAGAFSGERAGFDQWLDDRLLLGSSFGWSNGNLRFDRSGGTARDQSPQWDVYWRRNGNGNSYLFGDIGYSRHQMNFNRQIDLGITRQTAGTQRNLDVMRAWVEAGRDFRVGRSWLTPFGALSYAVLHGASFTEQGSTGFELIAQPSMHQRFSAAAGLRLGTDWLNSSGRWTKLNLTAGYRQLLQADDDARVAFTGIPEVTSVLGGMPRQRNTGWLQMNLATGGTRWDWLLSYDRQAGDDALSLGATFRF